MFDHASTSSAQIRSIRVIRVPFISIISQILLLRVPSRFHFIRANPCHPCHPRSFYQCNKSNPSNLCSITLPLHPRKSVPSVSSAFHFASLKFTPPTLPEEKNLSPFRKRFGGKACIGVTLIGSYFGTQPFRLFKFFLLRIELHLRHQ